MNQLLALTSTPTLHSIQIIHSRLQPKGLYIWNHPPGGLNFYSEFSPSPSDYPFFRDYPRLGRTDSEVAPASPHVNYTVVISCTRPVLRESAPLVKLIKAVSTAAHLESIVVVWMGPGSPHLKLPNVAVPVSVVSEGGPNKLTRQFWLSGGVQTDAVLHLNEDVELTSDEVLYVCVCVCACVRVCVRASIERYIGNIQMVNSDHKPGCPLVR